MMQEHETKLDEFQTPVTELVGGFRMLQIKTDHEDAQAEVAAKKIRDMKKAIEERHQMLVGPYKEITKKIDARKKSLVDPIDSLLDAIRKERGRYAAAKVELAIQEKRAIERQRQEELARKNREEQAARALGITDHHATLEYAAQDQMLIQEQNKITRESKTKGLRMVWKSEVISAAEVPRKYLVPDEAMIRRAVAAGEREIPGVRIWEEPYVSIR